MGAIPWRAAHISLAGLLALAPLVAGSPAQRQEEPRRNESRTAAALDEDVAGSFYEHSPEERIYFERDGDGEVAAVFLHGFGATIEAWSPIRSRLSRGYRSYFLDLKGFGRSSKPPGGDYSIERQAELVAGFLRHEGLRELILVGHSYGGAVAMRTAVELVSATGHPESQRPTLRALALLDCACLPQKPPAFLRVLTVPVVAPLVQNLSTDRYQVRLVLEKSVHRKEIVTDEMVERYLPAYRRPGAKPAGRAAMRGLVDPEAGAIVERYPEVAVPTLLIHGRQDPVVPPANAPRLAELLPEARLEWIDDCGHLPHEEQPERTAELLAAFLERWSTTPSR